MFGSGVLEPLNLTIAHVYLPWLKCVQDLFMVHIRHTAIWMKRRCLPVHNASKRHKLRSRLLFHSVLLLN